MAEQNHASRDQEAGKDRKTPGYHNPFTNTYWGKKTSFSTNGARKIRMSVLRVITKNNPH